MPPKPTSTSSATPASSRSRRKTSRRTSGFSETSSSASAAAAPDRATSSRRENASTPAEVAFTEFRRSLEDARSKFRKVIGIEPYNLRGPGRLPGLPASKDRVLAVTLTDNPTIKAAQADSDAAREAFHSAAGAFMPNVALEARGTEGHDTLGFPQHFTESSLKVVATWDIFRGGQDVWKRVETSERYNQTTMAHARLQRDANESVDKAWAARVITADRIAALVLQTEAARKVIEAYSKEYDLGQRSLIDLLNAENTSFNAQVSLISARSVAVFADYQLLAAMGKLIEYIRAPHPVDAEPLVPPGNYGLIPVKLPPILINIPQPGPEPLNVAAPRTQPVISGYVPPMPDRPIPSPVPGAGARASADEPRRRSASPTAGLIRPLRRGPLLRSCLTRGRAHKGGPFWGWATPQAASFRRASLRACRAGRSGTLGQTNNIAVPSCLWDVVNGQFRPSFRCLTAIIINQPTKRLRDRNIVF